jgi:hypothetical protein
MECDGRNSVRPLVELLSGKRKAPFPEVFLRQFQRVQYGTRNSGHVGERTAQPRLWSGRLGFFHLSISP